MHACKGLREIDVSYKPEPAPCCTGTRVHGRQTYIGFRGAVPRIAHLCRLHAQGRGVCAFELMPRQGDAVRRESTDNALGNTHTLIIMAVA